jgi:hypothetical protein
MTLGSHRFIGPAVGTVAAPLPRAAQSNGRAQHGFVVVDGGRT